MIGQAPHYNEASLPVQDSVLKSIAMNMYSPPLAIPKQLAKQLLKHSLKALLVLKNQLSASLLLIGVLALVGCSTTDPVEFRSSTELTTVSPPTVQPPQAQNQATVPPVTSQTPLPNITLQTRRANFMQTSASAETQRMADWVVDSGDNENRNFVIIDKKNAKAYVFHANGVLRGEAPVLLGLTVGDANFPGIGERPLSSIKPHEKTTPPGRFLSSLDKNLSGKDIIWIDYDGAVSLHAVVKGTPAEKRAERLASPTAADNRISFGCINAPYDFFTTIITPSFKESDGIVYILPDIKPLHHVFTTWYDVDERVKVANAVPKPKTSGNISTSTYTAASVSR